MRQNEQIKNKRRFYLSEFLVEKGSLLFTLVSVFTTVAIIFTLFGESFAFFREISIFDFLTGTIWAPTLKPAHFGVLPLLSGTLMIALGASLIALPIGLGSAIFLSEYASTKTRKIIKPMLEILAGIPSIVYGFIALNFITPIIRFFFEDAQIFNALSASIAVGIMIIPMVASLCEDAMMSVPNSIRNGAYALGANNSEVICGVVIPSAFSGIISSFVLAISRALGETMIVAIAAGQSPQLNLNPLKSVQTLTGFMVNISMGDIQHGTTEYKTLFAIGALLFLLTLFMNILAKTITSRNARKLNGK